MLRLILICPVAQRGQTTETRRMRAAQGRKEKVREEKEEGEEEGNDESIWPIIPVVLCVPLFIILTSYQIHLWDDYVCRATGFLCIGSFLSSLGVFGQGIAVLLMTVLSVGIWVMIVMVLIWFMSMICNGTYVSLAYGWLWWKYGRYPTGRAV